MCIGKVPAKYKKFEDLVDLCQCFAVVDQHDDRTEVPECQGNPSFLNCMACKCFKGYGCCPHVLAINHILLVFNVKHQLKKLPKKKDGRGGNLKAPPKALQRVTYYPTDDEDEQEEEEEEKEEEEEEEEGEEEKEGEEEEEGEEEREEDAENWHPFSDNDPDNEEDEQERVEAPFG